MVSPIDIDIALASSISCPVSRDLMIAYFPSKTSVFEEVQ